MKVWEKLRYRAEGAQAYSQYRIAQEKKQFRH